MKNGSGYYLQGLIAGEGFEPTTLLSKSLDNTVFFFLCILVAKVDLHPRCQEVVKNARSKNKKKQKTYIL